MKLSLQALHLINLPNTYYKLYSDGNEETKKKMILPRDSMKNNKVFTLQVLTNSDCLAKTQDGESGVFPTKQGGTVTYQSTKTTVPEKETDSPKLTGPQSPTVSTGSGVSICVLLSLVTESHNFIVQTEEIWNTYVLPIT